MSETDKHEKAIDTLGNLWIDDDDQAAAAYLREHFVTREEYEAGTSARIAQVEALTAERDRLRAALEVIRDNEWVENCLDPQWPAMIASQALNPEDV